MSKQVNKVSRRYDGHPYRKSAKRILAEDVGEDEIVDIIHKEISEFRENIYKRWKNEVVIVDVGGFGIECIVHDIKVVNGYPEYQVRPLTGDGNVWVTKFRSRRDTPMEKK